MKEKKLLVFATLLAATTICGAGCSQTIGGDETKTQIYVNNLTSGFGAEWMAKLKERFEEAHKDDVWEEGKKGVEVIVTKASQRASYMINQILPGRDEIYFTEQCSMYDFINKGYCLDITDAMTDKLTDYGETKSIEDKMSDELKAIYQIKQEDGVHYYSLPCYSGYMCITYDVDLFDEKGFYFAKTPVGSSTAGKFISKNNATKSAGPDGVEGTYDDGLPVTYDDFFELCDYMVTKQCVPYAHNGKNGPDYLNGFLEALAVDYEGAEEYEVFYSGEGTMHNLCNVDSAGNITRLGDTPITPDTAYKTYQMEGKYYAIKWLERMLSNEDYFGAKIASQGYTVGDCQDDFLRSKVIPNEKPIAMMGDGSWWINEAKQSFQAIADAYGEEGNSQLTHNLAVMPFPKATTARADKNRTNTLNDWLDSFGFIKSNVDEWKIPLLKEFIKFANTDESCVEFTETTNVCKTINYEMPKEKLEKLPYFTQTLIELKNRSTIIYPMSSSSFFQNNGNNFHHMYTFWSNVNGTDCEYPLTGIYTDSTKHWSAEDYFNGMYTYYKNNWTTMYVL